MFRTLNSIAPEKMNAQPAERARIYILMAWLHAVIQERLRYVPLGWSKRYEFNDADLRSALDTVDTWINNAAKGRANLPPNKIPWAALRSLLSQAVYGGKIDNESDQRLLDSFVNQIFTEKSFEHNFHFVAGDAASGVEAIAGPDGTTRDQFMQWLAELPSKQSPVWLGLPSHAERVLLAVRAQQLTVNVLKLQTVQEEDDGVKADKAQNSLEIPPWMRALSVQATQWVAVLPDSIPSVKRTAERIKDPLFRFFEREIVSGQNLLEQVRNDLKDVISCCQGQTKQTNDLRAILHALNRGAVFKNWLYAYKVPAGISVNAWIVDLANRIKQLISLSEAITANKDLLSLKLWIGGFFGPAAFVTATRQFSAAKHGWALEQTVLRLEAKGEGTTSSAGQCSFLLTGVRVEGAVLEDELLSPSPTLSYAIPITVLRWTKGDERAKDDLVEMPVYLNSTRREQIFSARFKSHVGSSEFYQRGVDLVLSNLAGAS